MPYQVFLSYQSDSRARVDTIRRALEARHIRCWMDKPVIDAGNDWLRTIQQGLEASKLLVLFLTKSCEASPYVTHEVLTADGAGMNIFVIRLEDYIPPKDPLNRVNRFQFIDAFGNSFESYIDKIVYRIERTLAEDARRAQQSSKKRSSPDVASPVADIAGLVDEAWIKGFLEPTIEGLAIKEGHGDGINRPFDFRHAVGSDTVQNVNDPPLPTLLNEATGRLLISGERGSGKTILMLQLVRDLLPNPEDAHHTKCPLYLNASSWVNPLKPADAQPKIRDWILSRLTKEYHLHPKRADALIKSQNLIFCLDGLDDIFEESNAGLAMEDFDREMNEAFRRELLSKFITELEEFATSKNQQIVLAGGEVVRDLLRDSPLSCGNIEIMPWTKDELFKYLKERGIGELAAFLESHPNIAKRLINSFFELQMLASIYKEKELARGLEARAVDGDDKFFSWIYDRYINTKYNLYLLDIRDGLAASGGRHLGNRKQGKKGAKVPAVDFSAIISYAPSIASYVGQPGHGEAFRLDMLQPFELPYRIRLAYRWYAGLLIGIGVAVSAGIPVLACDLIECFHTHATQRVVLNHVCVAVFGYILVGLIIAAAYRFTTRTWFGFVVGVAFGLGKGFASGSAVDVPEFRPGWDGGYHNGLAGLLVGIPLFTSILHNSRDVPDTITPIETWDPDTSQLIYWMLGAVAAGAIFYKILGRAKGFAGAFTLAVFAWTRFSKRPRLAPVHLRPNQAILYSCKNAVLYATLVALSVGIATGFAYQFQYGHQKGHNWEGITAGVMAMASFVTIFFFGGMPVAKHIALRYTLRRNGLVPRNLGAWLQMATHIGLMKQVGGGFVFSSEDIRGEYASRLKTHQDLYRIGWGVNHSDRES